MNPAAYFTFASLNLLLVLLACALSCLAFKAIFFGDKAPRCPRPVFGRASLAEGHHFLTNLILPGFLSACLVQSVYVVLLIDHGRDVHGSEDLFIGVIQPMQILFCNVSVLTLAVMGLDRVCAVLVPMLYKRTRTAHWHSAALLLTWLLSLLLFLLRMTAALSWRDYIVGVIIITVICFFVSSLCYFVVHVRLARQQAALQKTSVGSSVSLRRTTTRRLTRSFRIFSFVLLFSYVPFLWLTANEVFGDTSEHGIEVVKILAYMLIFSNGTILPLIFLWRKNFFSCQGRVRVDPDSSVS